MFEERIQKYAEQARKARTAIQHPFHDVEEIRVSHRNPRYRTVINHSHIRAQVYEAALVRAGIINDAADLAEQIWNRDFGTVDPTPVEEEMQQLVGYAKPDFRHPLLAELVIPDVVQAPRVLALKISKVVKNALDLGLVTQALEAEMRADNARLTTMVDVMDGVAIGEAFVRWRLFHDDNRADPGLVYDIINHDLPILNQERSEDRPMGVILANSPIESIIASLDSATSGNEYELASEAIRLARLMVVGETSYRSHPRYTQLNPISSVQDQMDHIEAQAKIDGLDESSTDMMVSWAKLNLADYPLSSKTLGRFLLAREADQLAVLYGIGIYKDLVARLQKWARLDAAGLDSNSSDQN